jgi:D-erythro-7,8-dihydroneopterin triphosphate epimerase
MKKATIRITDLLLRAVVGGNDWEKDIRQDVLINIEVEYDARNAVDSDEMADAFDYKKLKRGIIDKVERSRFRLLESLTNMILSLVMEDPRALAAVVRVDKPGALRYAKTVSVEMSDRRPA